MNPEDLAHDLNLPLNVVKGVCAELARNPDHAQQLQLCQAWGIGWPEMQRLAEMRKPDLESIGRGLAVQATMICSMAQNALAVQLSNPAVVHGLQPKELSSIMKQSSDVALGWSKESPANMGGGNTFNIIGSGGLQDIIALKQMQQDKSSAKERLLARGLPLEVLAQVQPEPISLDVNDY